MELYHYPFSTCSQKVRLVFAEKGLAFESREVDLMSGGQHDPAYVKLNPKHVVPTVVHEGRTLIESTLIIRYLDDLSPEPPMQPTEPYERYLADAWIKHVDDALHPAAPVVTFAIGPRNLLLQQPEEVREAEIQKMPDPRERAERRSVIEHGVKAPEFADALGVFVRTLDAMEDALAERPWLSGEGFGLADATVLPYVRRLEDLAMQPLLAANVRPHVASWAARVAARPSYATAVEAWLPGPAVEMLRANGKAVWADVAPIAALASVPERRG